MRQIDSDEEASQKKVSYVPSKKFPSKYRSKPQMNAPRPQDGQVFKPGDVEKNRQKFFHNAPSNNEEIRNREILRKQASTANINRKPEQPGSKPPNSSSNLFGQPGLINKQRASAPDYHLSASSSSTNTTPIHSPPSFAANKSPTTQKRPAEHPDETEPQRKLSKDNDGLAKRNERLKRINESLKEELKGMKIQKEEAEKSNDELKKELENKDAELKKNLESKSTEASESTLKAELEKKAKEVEKLKNAHSTMKTAYQKQCVDKIKQLTADYQAQFDEANKKLDDRTAECKDLKAKLESNDNASTSKISKDLVTEQNKNKDLVVKIEELEKRLTEMVAQQNIGNVTPSQSSNKLETENKLLKEENKLYKTELAEIKNSVDAMDVELKTQSAEIQEKDDLIDKLNETIQEKTNNIKKLEEIVQQNLSKIEEHEKMMAVIKKQIEELESNESNLRSILTEKREVVKQLEEAKNKLDRENKELKVQNSIEQAPTITKLQLEKTRLEKELKKATEENNQFMPKLIEYNNLIDKWRDRYHELSRQRQQEFISANNLEMPNRHPTPPADPQNN